VSLPRYSAYKSSGHDWIGAVPNHWAILPVKRVFGVVGGSTPASDIAAFWDGDVPWVTPADLSKQEQFEISESQRSITAAGVASCSTTVAPAGSIILSTRAPIGSLAISARPMCTNQGCKTLVPKADAFVRYFAYQLVIATEPLNLRGRGTTFLELSADELERFAVPTPPAPEQRAIAAFLDRETAKIDALVAEQRRLMDLLREKRQAVISHAVTKGLNPDAPMKDSGVAFVGSVPDHWSMVPLMRLTQADRPIMYGIVLPGPDVGDGVPILKGGNVKPHRMNLDALARTTQEIEAPYARARLRAGDLVYAIRGTIGECEEVPLELENCNITQDVARIAPSLQVIVKWLRFALLSAPLQEYLASDSLGAAVRGINIFDLKRTPVPTPPWEEQAEIAQYLEKRCAEFDGLIAESAKAAKLLAERRAALITAAVTGQIDVRGLATAEAA
jgi:type I restriction enzyme, S subunit